MDWTDDGLAGAKRVDAPAESQPEFFAAAVPALLAACWGIASLGPRHPIAAPDATVAGFMRRDGGEFAWLVVAGG
jgi:hypothetical protein